MRDGTEKFSLKEHRNGTGSRVSEPQGAENDPPPLTWHIDGKGPNKWQHTEKHIVRDKTDRTWFGRLLRHPAGKWSGSILTTLKPTWGSSLVITEQ